MRPLVQLALCGVALGFVVAAILFCGFELYADPAPGPPIILPTTYGPPK